MASCTRCKRALKDPASVQRGYGPICWAKHQADIEKEEKEMEDRFIDAPRDESIVMLRDGKGVATNVPHVVTHHSPTGFEFGYGGSGPADLALNILEVVLHDIGYKGAITKDTWKKEPCFKLAWSLHQAFKWDFVANMDRQGGSIKTNDIVAWIHQHEPMVGDLS